VITRFAPSTTGEAHPGTLLSALLVWLDARSRGGRALLRLEDLDTTRVKAAWSAQLALALAYLGLDWDGTSVQSGRAAAYHAALDQLAAAGRLYPCSCSRADRARGPVGATTRGRTGGRRAPDGGWAYANTCRGTPLPPGGWRAVSGNVRVQLPDDRVELVDDGGVDVSQTPAVEMGDPIVRRRDGVIAYQLAVVVDDGDAGITDVIRGRDIAPSTATQIMLQRLLGLPAPRYRHHFLLLERSGDKLAKLHGSIPFSTVRTRYTGPELVGALACAADLVDAPRATTPRELLKDFSWDRVPTHDRVTRWDGRLVVEPAGMNGAGRSRDGT
jgi:glutamyl-Q tRNA(Asp) synthetase